MSRQLGGLVSSIINNCTAKILRYGILCHGCMQVLSSLWPNEKNIVCVQEFVVVVEFAIPELLSTLLSVFFSKSMTVESITACSLFYRV